MSSIVSLKLRPSFWTAFPVVEKHWSGEQWSSKWVPHISECMPKFPEYIHTNNLKDINITSSTSVHTFLKINQPDYTSIYPFSKERHFFFLSLGIALSVKYPGAMYKEDALHIAVCIEKM